MKPKDLIPHIKRYFILIGVIIIAMFFATFLLIIYDSYLSSTYIINYEKFLFVACSALIIFWTIQIFMVRVKLKELMLSDDLITVDFCSKLPFWYSPHRWFFFVVVIVLPVGLSFVSHVFSTYTEVPIKEEIIFDGIDPDKAGAFLEEIEPNKEGIVFEEIAFQFAISVFIIMITLQIAALYNLPDLSSLWRPLLIAALVIDLLAFTTFSLLDFLKGKYGDGVNGDLMILFFLISGVMSIVSSVFPLYYVKTYEQHYRGELKEVAAPAFWQEIQKLGDRKD